MSKWRPSKNCLYVIPDIHGAISKLKLICNRILPLRQNINNKDTLLFLGDYIDRQLDSYRVLDFLIDLKSQYPDQTVFLKGNHEQMLLIAANKVLGRSYSLQDRQHAYKLWIENGGYQTVIAGRNEQTALRNSLAGGNSGNQLVGLRFVLWFGVPCGSQPDWAGKSLPRVRRQVSACSQCYSPGFRVDIRSANIS